MKTTLGMGRRQLIGAELVYLKRLSHYALVRKRLEEIIIENRHRTPMGIEPMVVVDDVFVNVCHHHLSAAEQATTIFLHPQRSELDWLYGLGQMLFPHPLVSVVCRTGGRNTDGQYIAFHALAHRGHIEGTYRAHTGHIEGT